MTRRLLTPPACPRRNAGASGPDPGDGRPHHVLADRDRSPAAMIKPSGTPAHPTGWLAKPGGQPGPGRRNWRGLRPDKGSEGRGAAILDQPRAGPGRPAPRRILGGVARPVAPIELAGLHCRARPPASGGGFHRFHRVPAQARLRCPVGAAHLPAWSWRWPGRPWLGPRRRARPFRLAGPIPRGPAFHWTDRGGVGMAPGSFQVAARDR